MKKKILSFLVALCMILPFGFALTACGGHTHTASTEWLTDDEKHWKVCTDTECAAKLDEADHEFTEETIAATIDAAGKVVKTCETCGKVIETPIPKIVQTRADMIAALPNAVKLDNFKGSIQEVYTYKTNTEDRITVAESEEIEIEFSARKEDGTAVYYVTNNQKPESYLGQEYISDGVYFEKVGNEYRANNLTLDSMDDPTKTDLGLVERVGKDYSQGYILDNIKENLDYLLLIEDESTMITSLKNTLARYIPIYQEMFAGYFGDVFTFEVDDIVVEAELSYADGIYTAEGTIILDELTHTSPSPSQKINDFKVEFLVEYESDLVLRNYSKFIYTIDSTPTEANDELTEIYMINDFVYSREVENSHFEKINSIVDNSQEAGTPVDIKEEVRFFVNGKSFTSTYVDFNTAINGDVDLCLETYIIANDIDEYSTIEIFLDEDYTIPYDENVDVIVKDYYGTDVYIKITANQGYASVITNYVVYYEDVDYKFVVSAKVEIVEKSGEYTLNLKGPDPDFELDEVDYDDKIVVNGTVIAGVSFDVNQNEYLIDLYYITNAMM